MKPSRLSVAKEIRKRSLVQAKPLDLDPNFIKQNSFIQDTNKHIVAQCSRRAGKTTGLAMRFFKTLEKHPKSQCIYVALTYASAKDIMWPVLQEINDRYNIGCVFTESKGTMKHPNGAILRIVGADMKNFIKRFKGRKYPGVAIDEVQDFGSHLQSLIDDVFGPSLIDYADGWIALTGTPGPVPRGYFYEVTRERKYGYSFHEWTMFENPNLPNPQKDVEDLKIKRGWDSNHPTLLREYYNKWVLDLKSLWITYDEKTNHYQQLPNLIPDKLTYIFGIDLGFKDSDAIAVLGWHEKIAETYLVEELITPKQGITSLVEQIKRLDKKYGASKMLIDEGGLGKKIAEEIRREHSLPVIAADKALKQQNVAFLNDALRTGKFKAKSASRFAQDSYAVQIDWDKSTHDRIVIKKEPHSDIIDAVLYAFKESPAYTYQAEVQKPKRGSKEWADQQQDEMWEAAQAHFEQQAELKRSWEPQ